MRQKNARYPAYLLRNDLTRIITIAVMVIAAPTAAPPITQGSYSSDVKKVVINFGTIDSRSQCRPVAAVATLYQSHTGETTRPVICARRQSFIVW